MSAHFVKYGHITYILHGSLQEVLKVDHFLLTAELGSAAGVTSHPPQLFSSSVDASSKFADDIFELFKGLGFNFITLSTACSHTLKSRHNMSGMFGDQWCSVRRDISQSPNFD